MKSTPKKRVLLQSPGYVPAPLRTVRISVTRSGRYTDSYKEVFLWVGLSDRTDLVTIPVYQHVTAVFLATAVDGNRAFFAHDYDADRPLAGLVTPSLMSDLELKIDLNDGSSSGADPTDPAVSYARVLVERLPQSREVIALEHKADGAWRYAGATRVGGTGQMELQVTGGDVYVMAADDYGAPFQPNLQIDVGATIRPSHFQGWLYRCTEAGRLPIDEPEWWPELGDNPARLVGTARLQAVRYYQPIAHGPIKYELV